MRRRPKIGDIIEIPLPKGFGYAQYTHKHDKPPHYGALLRVFPGVHKTRPANFTDLANADPQFFTFFPLGAALWRGIVGIAGNIAIPDRFRNWPTMRCAGFIDRNGRVHDWWISDWTKDTQVKTLTAEQRRLSLLEVINDTLLIERIVEGWKPEEMV